MHSMGKIVFGNPVSINTPNRAHAIVLIIISNEQGDEMSIGPREGYD